MLQQEIQDENQDKSNIKKQKLTNELQSLAKKQDELKVLENKLSRKFFFL